MRYEPSPETIRLIRGLAESDLDLSALIEHPEVGERFLMRLAALYEHAPSFIFGGEASPEELKKFIVQTASSYLRRFILNSLPSELSPNPSPKKVVLSTFWAREVWDPIDHLIEAVEMNLEGVEITLDFHPFNPVKLLPGEIPRSKREEIHWAVENLGLHLSYHSPIVGPYPGGRPGKRGLFYDPTENMELMREIIELAYETGAGSVVIHLIDAGSLEKIARIVEYASGTDVRVTLENYYDTEFKQDSQGFISVLEKLKEKIPSDLLESNFGITFDPGHYNLEGEDPIISAARVGRWCLENGVKIEKVHATVNYGPLRFSPPNYSADIHDRVSNKGLNNELIVKLLRSMGHEFVVVAEQISPLSERDVELIDSAQRAELEKYESYVKRGRELLDKAELDEAYCFIAGLEGIEALKEYMIYRRIQGISQMTSETARAATIAFMSLSESERERAVRSLEELVSSIAVLSDKLPPSQVMEVCDRLRGAILDSINREMLNELVSEVRRIAPGQIICKEGERGDEMFYLMEGSAEVIIGGEKVGRIEPGELFGEISILCDVPRTATIRAAGELELGVIDKYRALSVLQEKGDLARALIYRLYITLPKRLREMNSRYVSASIKWPGSIRAEITSKLERMKPKEIEKLFEEGRFYPEGEMVIKKGEDGAGLYFVGKGEVEVYDFFKGKLVLLGVLGEGELFGEMSLIDRSKTSASVMSRGAYLKFMPRDRFDELLADPDLSYRIMSTICSIIMERIYRLDRLFRLSLQNA